MSKGSLWGLMNKYNIKPQYYQRWSYVYPTNYLGNMTKVEALTDYNLIISTHEGPTTNHLMSIKSGLTK